MKAWVEFKVVFEVDIDEEEAQDTPEYKEDMKDEDPEYYTTEVHEKSALQAVAVNELYKIFFVLEDQAMMTSKGVSVQEINVDFEGAGVIEEK